jgi:hypothetical protein
MSVVAFPALLPSSRVHTAGAFPTALYRSAAGFRAQTRVGIGSHGHEVSLSFDNLPMASAALIRSHWANAGGTAETFDLPAVVWSAGQFGVPLVAGLQWRYAAQPEFRDEECERQSVSVRLVTAPCSMDYRGVELHLGSLLDVGLGAPMEGQELVFNGSCWISY